MVKQAWKDGKEGVETGVTKYADEILSKGTKIIVNSWDEAVKTVDDLIKPQVNKLKQVLDYAKYIDDLLGKHFSPAIRIN